MDCDESDSEEGEISENEDTTGYRNELVPDPVENEVGEQRRVVPSFQCPECKELIPAYGFGFHLEICLNFPTSKRKARNSATGTYCELSDAEGSHEPSQKSDVESPIQEQPESEEEFKCPRPVKKSRKKPQAKKKDTFAEPGMDKGRGKKNSKKRKAENSGSESEFENPSEQKKLRKKIQRKVKHWTDSEHLPQPMSDAELESPWSKKKFKRIQEPKMKDLVFGEREAGQTWFQKRMEKRQNLMRARATKCSVKSNTTKDDFKENRLESVLVHHSPQKLDEGGNNIPDLVDSPLKNLNREEQENEPTKDHGQEISEDDALVLVANKHTKSAIEISDDEIITRTDSKVECNLHPSQEERNEKINESADIMDCTEEITRKADDTTTKTLQEEDTEPQPPHRWVVKLSPTPVPKKSPKAKKKKARNKELCGLATEKFDEMDLLLASKQASCAWQIRAQSAQYKRVNEWTKLFGEPDIIVKKDTLPKKPENDELRQLFLEKLEVSDFVPQTQREANVSDAPTTTVVSTTKDEHLQDKQFSEAIKPKEGVRRRLLFDVPKIEEPVVKQKPKMKSFPIAGPSGVSKKRPLSEHEELISDPKMEVNQSKKPYDGTLIIKLKHQKLNESESNTQSTVIKQQEPVEKLVELAAGDIKPKDPESSNQSSEEQGNRDSKKSEDNQNDYKVVTTDVSAKFAETKGMELAKHPQKEPEKNLVDLTPITKPKSTESKNQLSEKLLNKESKKGGDFQEKISDPRMKPKQLKETHESSDTKLKRKRDDENEHKPKVTESNSQLPAKQLNKESEKSGDYQENISGAQIKPKQFKESLENTNLKLKLKRHKEDKQWHTEEVRTHQTIVKPNEPKRSMVTKGRREPDMKHEEIIIRHEVPASTFDTKPKDAESISKLSEKQLKKLKKSDDYQEKTSDPKMKPKKFKETLENSNIKLKLKKHKENKQWQTEEIRSDQTIIKPNEPESHTVTKEQREPDMKHEELIITHEVPAFPFDAKIKATESKSQLSEKQLNRESQKSEDYQEKIIDPRMKPKQLKKTQDSHDITVIKLKQKRHGENKLWQTEEMKTYNTVIKPNEPKSNTVIQRQREPDMKQEELIIKHKVPASAFDTMPKAIESNSQVAEKPLNKEPKRSGECQEKISDPRMKPKQLKKTQDSQDSTVIKLERKKHEENKHRQAEEMKTYNTVIKPNEPKSNTVIQRQREPDMKQEELIIKHKVPASAFDTMPKAIESNSQVSEKPLNKEPKRSGECQEKISDPRMKPKQLKKTQDSQDSTVIKLERKRHEENKHRQAEEMKTYNTVIKANEPKSNTVIQRQREPDMKQEELIIKHKVPASTFDTMPKAIESNSQLSEKYLNKEPTTSGECQEKISDPRIKPKQLKKTQDSQDSTVIKLEQKRHEENKHGQAEEMKTYNTVIKPNEPKSNTVIQRQREPDMKQEELIIKHKVPVSEFDTMPKAIESNSQVSEKPLNKEPKTSGECQEKISDPRMKPKQLKKTQDSQDSTVIKLERKRHEENKHRQAEEMKTYNTVIKPNEPKSNTVTQRQREPDMKQEELIIKHKVPVSTFDTKPKAIESNSQLSEKQLNKESQKSEDYQLMISDPKMKSKQLKKTQDSQDITVIKLKQKRHEENTHRQAERMKTYNTVIKPNEPKSNTVIQRQREPDMKQEELIIKHTVPASTFDTMPKAIESNSQVSEKYLNKEPKTSGECHEKISDPRMKPKQLKKTQDSQDSTVIKLERKRHDENKHRQAEEMKTYNTVIKPNEPKSNTVIQRQREPDMKQEELIIKHTVPASTFDTMPKAIESNSQVSEKPLNKEPKTSWECQEKISDPRMKPKQLKKTQDSQDSTVIKLERKRHEENKHRQAEEMKTYNTVIKPNEPKSNTVIQRQREPDLKQEELIIKHKVPASTFDTKPKAIESNSQVSEKYLNKEPKTSGECHEKISDPRMKPKQLKKTQDSQDSTVIKLEQKRHEENKHRQAEEMKTYNTVIKPNEPKSNTVIQRQREPDMKQEELIIKHKVPASTFDTMPKAIESNSQVSENYLNKEPNTSGECQEKISDPRMKPKQLKKTQDSQNSTVIKLERKRHEENEHRQAEEMKTYNTIIKPNEPKSNTVIQRQREPDMKQEELIIKHKIPASTFDTMPKAIESNSQVSEKYLNKEPKTSGECQEKISDPRMKPKQLKKTQDSQDSTVIKLERKRHDENKHRQAEEMKTYNTVIKPNEPKSNTVIQRQREPDMKQEELIIKHTVPASTFDTMPKAIESNSQVSEKPLNKEPKTSWECQEKISDPRMKPKQLKKTQDSQDSTVIKLERKRHEENKHRQAEEMKTYNTVIKPNEPKSNTVIQRQREPDMKQEELIIKHKVPASTFDTMPKAIESNSQVSEKYLNKEPKTSGECQEKISDPRMKPKQLRKTQDSQDSTVIKLERKRHEENKHRQAEEMKTYNTVIKPNEPKSNTVIQRQREPDMKQEELIIKHKVPASTFDTMPKAIESNSQVSENYLNKEPNTSGECQEKISDRRMKPKQLKKTQDSQNSTVIKLERKRHEENEHRQAEEMKTYNTIIKPNEPKSNTVIQRQREPDMKQEELIIKHKIPASTFDTMPKAIESNSQVSEKPLNKEPKTSGECQEKISDPRMKPKQLKKTQDSQDSTVIKLERKRHEEKRDRQAEELKTYNTVIKPNEPKSNTVIQRQREPDLKQEELIIKHKVPASTFDTKPKAIESNSQLSEKQLNKEPKTSGECQEKISDPRMKPKQLKKTQESQDRTVIKLERKRHEENRHRQAEEMKTYNTVIKPNEPKSNTVIQRQREPDIKQEESIIKHKVPASTFDTKPKAIESNSQLSEKQLNKEPKTSGECQEKISDPRMKPNQLKKTVESTDMNLKHKSRDENKPRQTIIKPYEPESKTIIKRQGEPDMKQKGLVIKHAVRASTFDTKPMKSGDCQEKIRDPKMKPKQLKETLESTDTKLKEKRHKENKHQQTKERQREHTILKPTEPESNTVIKEQGVPQMKREEIIIRRQVPASTFDTKPKATESSSKLSEKALNKESNKSGDYQEMISDPNMKPKQPKKACGSTDIQLKRKRDKESKHRQAGEIKTVQTIIKPNEAEINTIIKEQRKPDMKQELIIRRGVPESTFDTKPKKSESNSRLSDEQANNESKKREDNQTDYKVVITDVRPKCPETKGTELAEHPQKEPEKNLMDVTPRDTKLKDPESNNQSSKDQANNECKVVTTDVSTKCPETKGMELDKNEEVLASISKQLDMKPNDPECLSVVDLTEEPDTSTPSPSTSKTPITPQVAHATTTRQQKKKTIVDPKEYQFYKELLIMRKVVNPEEKAKRHLKKAAQQRKLSKDDHPSVDLTPVAGSLSSQNIESIGRSEEENRMEPQKIPENLLCQETDMEPLDLSTENPKKTPAELLCQETVMEPLDLSTGNPKKIPEELLCQVNNWEPLDLSMASCKPMKSASTSKQEQITQGVQKERDGTQIETKPNDPESRDQRLEPKLAVSPDFAECKQVVYLSQPPCIKILQNILLQAKGTYTSEIELLGFETILDIETKRQETEYESPSYEPQSKEPLESQDTEDEGPDQESHSESQDTEDEGPDQESHSESQDTEDEGPDQESHSESQDTEDEGPDQESHSESQDTEDEGPDQESHSESQDTEDESPDYEPHSKGTPESQDTQAEGLISDIDFKERPKYSVRNRRPPTWKYKDMEMNYSEESSEPESQASETIVTRETECSETEEEGQESELDSKESPKQSVPNLKKDAELKPGQTEENQTGEAVLSEEVAGCFLEKPSSNLLMNELQTETNTDISEIDYHAPDSIVISETEYSETENQGKDFELYSKETPKHSVRNRRAAMCKYKDMEIDYSPNKNDAEPKKTGESQTVETEIIVIRPESNDSEEVGGWFLEKPSDLQPPQTILDIEAKNHPDPEVDSKEARKHSVRKRKPPMWKYKDMELDYSPRYKQSKQRISNDNEDKNSEKQNENVETKEVDRIRKHSSRQTKNPKKRRSNQKRRESEVTKLKNELHSVRVEGKTERMALFQKYNHFLTEQDVLKEKNSNLTVAHDNMLKAMDDLRKELNRSNNPEIAEHIPPGQAGPSLLEQDSNNISDMDIEYWSPPNDENSEKETNDVDWQPVGCEEIEQGNQPELTMSVEDTEVHMESTESSVKEFFWQSVLNM